MNKIEKILVPVDLHSEADCESLIKSAVDIAEKFDAELTFVNVIDVDLDSSMVDRFDDIQNAYAKAARAQLENTIKKYVPTKTDANVLVLNGRSYSKVVEAADDLEADLIVIHAHKPAMKEFLLGMTAARVVRHAHCSVWVVRNSTD